MKLKLVTINIFQGALLDEVCAFIEKERPDIVTMQEVYDGHGSAAPLKYRSWEEIKKRLRFKAADYEAALIDNKPPGAFPMGNGILSQFPITSRDFVFFNEPFNPHYVDDAKNSSKMPHVLQHVVLQTPAGEVNVYNLHGTWDLNGDNFSDKRRQMSEAILAATKGKKNVLLAGDTNAKPTNQAMRNLEPQLKNVFGTELKTTFNMSRKDNPGYATAAVDMVFVSPDVKIISKSCPQVDISDHLPLVVEVEI
ncbi:MAG TPA: endonuclease/exonuclease/phosphatase family protein [Candidatus Saccharimonadales bacterium]|nr:endonuclease/exonuclease/phosphatase family protein [Candidatus Saccharimonadales bacterium]